MGNTPTAYTITTLAVDANGIVRGRHRGTAATSSPSARPPARSSGSAASTETTRRSPSQDGTVYVGGHFNNYCGHVFGTNACAVPTARDHLLASTRRPATSCRGTRARTASSACSRSPGGDGTIEAGGDFTKLGGVSQQGFGEFPEISLPTLTDSAGGLPTSTHAGDGHRVGIDRLGARLRRLQVRDVDRWRHDLERARNGPTATVKTVGDDRRPVRGARRLRQHERLGARHRHDHVERWRAGRRARPRTRRAASARGRASGALEDRPRHRAALGDQGRRAERDRVVPAGAQERAVGAAAARRRLVAPP